MGPWQHPRVRGWRKQVRSGAVESRVFRPLSRFPVRSREARHRGGGHLIHFALSRGSLEVEPVQSVKQCQRDRRHRLEKAAHASEREHTSLAGTICAKAGARGECVRQRVFRNPERTLVRPPYPGLRRESILAGSGARSLSEFDRCGRWAFDGLAGASRRMDRERRGYASEQTPDRAELLQFRASGSRARVRRQYSEFPLRLPGRCRGELRFGEGDCLRRNRVSRPGGRHLLSPGVELHVIGREHLQQSRLFILGRARGRFRC